MTNEQSKILEKVRLLIAHADGTPNEREAANYWAKAQELMTKYAISESLVRAQDPGASSRDPIVVRRVPFGKDARRRAKVVLANEVAKASRCQLIDARESIVLIGRESDIAFVEMLFTSLLLQSARFLSQARREHGVEHGKGSTFSNNFFIGFANRVGERLREAVKRATASEQDRRGVSLALRDDAEKVKEAAAKAFPNTRQVRPRFNSDVAAQSAGRRAGDRADIGAKRMGSRRELR